MPFDPIQGRNDVNKIEYVRGAVSGVRKRGGNLPPRKEGSSMAKKGCGTKGGKGTSYPKPGGKGK